MPPTALVHAAAVDGAVRATVTALADDLRGIDRGLNGVAEALVDAASGGKGLRGALVCWSSVAHGGGAAEDVLGAAVAVELVHLSALVHDDVIDRADTRRGRLSVHARFADALAAEGATTGSAAEYGRSVAILLGDVLLAAAPAALERCHVDVDALVHARTALVRLQVEVMAGQFLDVDAAARRAADVDRTLTIATLKSGRYSVGRPLELGALLAGVPAEEAARMLVVGDPIGVAFQLRDDLLGVFGDPATTGKPAGADLVEGKRTLLVAETLARLSGAAHDTFEAGLGRADLGPDGVAALRATIEASGARTALEQRIDDLLVAARDAARGLGLPPGEVEALDGLAVWAATRHG